MLVHSSDVVTSIHPGRESWVTPEFTLAYLNKYSELTWKQIFNADVAQQDEFSSPFECLLCCFKLIYRLVKFNPWKAPARVESLKTSVQPITKSSFWWCCCPQQSTYYCLPFSRSVNALLHTDAIWNQGITFWHLVCSVLFQPELTVENLPSFLSLGKALLLLFVGEEEDEIGRRQNQVLVEEMRGVVESGRGRMEQYLACWIHLYVQIQHSHLYYLLSFIIYLWY